MAEDNVPPNPSPTFDHKVADLLNISKLKDAKSAGTYSSESCTLILSEGYSETFFVDDDGLHMIGLLINFLHYFWPSLLKLNGFMRVFITPIFKASDKNDAVLLFYTLPEYKAWKEKLGNKATEYKIKNYQGPEAIETEEAKYYYRHPNDFFWIDECDDDAIKIAFTMEMIRQRYFWLQLGLTQVLSLSAFVNLVTNSYGVECDW